MMHHLLAEQQRALLFCKEDKLGLAGQGGAGPQAHRERETPVCVIWTHPFRNRREENTKSRMVGSDFYCR